MLSSSSPAPMIRLASPMRSAREPPDGREADERADDRRAHQRGPLGVLHRPVLGHRLEEHEDHDDFEHDAEEHAEAAEEVLGDDADQGGRDQLADQDEQQDRVEEVGRVLDQAGQLARPALALVDQRLGLDPVHPHQAGLGHGQHARPGQQDGDDDDEDRVLEAWKPVGGEQVHCSRPGAHPVEAVAAAAAPAPPCARASASSSWSMPSRCSRPWTTSSATSSSRGTSCSAALRAATTGQITTSPSRVSAPCSADGPGPAAAEVGRAPGRARLVLDRERQHVGRARSCPGTAR